jgi:site-specific DNA recombinase
MRAPRCLGLAAIAANPVKRRVRLKSSPAILAGRIFDDRDNCMTPSHSNKSGVRYRYYVSRALLRKQTAEAGSVARVPEALVLDCIRKHLADTPTVDSTAHLSDRELIDRYLDRVIVRPKSLQVKLILEPPAAVGPGEPTPIAPAAGSAPIAPMIVLPWIPPSVAAEKGIAHEPGTGPAMKSQTRVAGQDDATKRWGG